MAGSIAHLEIDSRKFRLPKKQPQKQQFELGSSWNLEPSSLNLDMMGSMSTARIPSVDIARKRKEITFYNCSEVKFIKFLLSTMGVPCYGASKFTQYLQVALFQALLALHLVKNTTCVFTKEDTQDLYGGLVFTSTLMIVLWWYVNLNRSKLVHLYHTTAATGLSRKFVALVFTCSLTLFPPIAKTIIKIASGHYYDHNSRFHWCRNYWVPSDFKYFGATVFLFDLVTGYVTYSVFFITAFVYCYFCFLIIRRFNTSGDQEICRKLLMNNVKDFERVMSFPVLIVLGQIVLDVFTMVSLASEHQSWMFMLGFMVSTAQMMAWFVLIVFFADRVQSQCLKSIDTVFEGIREPNCYKYKELKRSCTLTAWSMFVINRKLLLNWMASLVTYSIVISELKERG